MESMPGLPRELFSSPPNTRPAVQSCTAGRWVRKFRALELRQRVRRPAVAAATLGEIVLQPPGFDLAPFHEVIDEIREPDAQRDEAGEHRDFVAAAAERA